ncbi:MAG: helix-turn-helix domain-containing protein [Firmicutes bacterium]|nr:helix-turn-helix domain-containing protein [Bacillota bacterium]
MVNPKDKRGKVLTTAELCQWLGISSWMALKWRKGGMPFLQKGRIVRYYEGDVREWLDKNNNERSYLNETYA